MKFANLTTRGRAASWTRGRRRASLECGYEPPDAALAETLEKGKSTAYNGHGSSGTSNRSSGNCGAHPWECRLRSMISSLVDAKSRLRSPCTASVESTPSTAEVMSLVSVFREQVKSRLPRSSINPWFLPPDSRFKKSPESRWSGENQESVRGRPDTQKQPVNTRRHSWMTSAC